MIEDMGTYRQYCPVASASEILAERWKPLIMRNLTYGSDTFSAIADGVPSMSRSMLVKRLDELERAGIIESRRKPDGRGHYRLTEAGADLALEPQRLERRPPICLRIYALTHASKPAAADNFANAGVTRFPTSFPAVRRAV